MTQIQNEAFDNPLFIPAKNKILMPDKQEFRELVPGTMPLITLGGRRLRVADNAPGINHCLWNKGHVVPSPILFDGYDWSLQPAFETQKQTAAMLVSRARAYVLNELGTGKTLAALMAVDWLILKGYVKRALIIAPLSTLETVWSDEVRFRTARLWATVLHGAKKERIKRLNAGNWNVAIINHDGVKVLLDNLIESRFDVAIVDELAVYRDHTTARWKKTEALLRHIPIVWGMTGAPTPNGPWDAYGQVRLITPGRLGGQTYKRWRDRVAVEDMPGLWLPRKGSKDVVYNAMQPAVRYKRSEVLDLPDDFMIHRRVLLSKKQVQLYNAIRDQAYASFAGKEVTAVNAAVQMGKLLQICCGAVYCADTSTLNLDADDRYEVAGDIAAEAEGKTIIFAPFKHVCALILEYMQKRFGPNAVKLVTGDTPAGDRDIIFTDFQDRNAPLKMIVAHPKCMAHGITLTEANTTIWWSPITSTETYIQANGRTRRAGQTREQFYYHLFGMPIERRVYSSIHSHAKLQEAILKMFEDKLL